MACENPTTVPLLSCCASVGTGTCEELTGLPNQLVVDWSELTCSGFPGGCTSFGGTPDELPDLITLAFFRDCRWQDTDNIIAIANREIDWGLCLGGTFPPRYNGTHIILEDETWRLYLRCLGGTAAFWEKPKEDTPLGTYERGPIGFNNSAAITGPATLTVTTPAP